MNCKKCGAPLENNSKFCGVCGSIQEPNIQQTDVIQQPEMIQPVPNMVQPEQPGIVQPAPNMVQPEQPGIVQPAPNMVQPEQPGIVQPVPNMVQPEQPGMVQPVPNMVQPEQPGIVQPVPNIVQPEQPEIIQPVPNMVQPEQPGMVQPVPTVEPINMSNDMLPPIGTTPQDEEPQEKKKHSVLPAILIILILLVVAAFCIYKFLFNKPDKIVKGLINTAYDKFENIIVDTQKYDFENEPIIVNGDLTLDTNIEGLENLKDIKLEYKTGIDSKNKKIEVGGLIKEDNEELLNAAMYLLDNNAYLSLKDIYPSLIKINDTEMNFNFYDLIEKNYTQEDIKFIVKSYKDILIESLDMNDFKASNDKIEIDGKEIKVSKLTYDLNQKNLKKLSDKIIEKTLENEELMSKLTKVTGTSVEQLKSELEESKNEPESESYVLQFTINIYTKPITNEFVGMDILNDSIGNVEIRNSKDKITMNLKSNETSAIYTIKTNGKESITIEYKGMIDDEESTSTMTITSKEIDSKNAEGTLKINVNKGNKTFNISSNYKITAGESFADIDTTNSKFINELTPEEQSQIYLDIMTKLQNSKLYNMINSLLSNESNYDYDSDLSSTLSDTL